MGNKFLPHWYLQPLNHDQIACLIGGLAIGVRRKVQKRNVRGMCLQIISGARIMF